ncbi:MAG: hypothetical protein DMG76_27355 [Acidobacteria bacterium]|nr:MAG: hypothetical protein DMG76_27355 [Acidobacteriota bacterium]
MSLEARAYAVHFADGSTEQPSLTLLGSGSYRAEESSLVDDSINLGDVIANEGGIRFLSVSQKSSYTTLRWTISKSAAESEGLPRFLKQVVEVGGLWEQVMGGLLILHIPQSSAFDAKREFKRQIGQSWIG